MSHEHRYTREQARSIARGGSAARVIALVMLLTLALFTLPDASAVPFLPAPAFGLVAGAVVAALFWIAVYGIRSGPVIMTCDPLPVATAAHRRWRSFDVALRRVALWLLTCVPGLALVRWAGEWRGLGLVAGMLMLGALAAWATFISTGMDRRPVWADCAHER